MFFDSFLDNNMKNKDSRKDVILRFQQHNLQQHQGRQQQQLWKECLPDEVVRARSSGEINEPKADVEHDSQKAVVVVNGSSGASCDGGGDGAIFEVVKRRRGRPLGSKNKPKPPVVITQKAETPAAMRPHLLEIPAGKDVADAIARFARRRDLGLCVLAGTGSVANVTLRQSNIGGVPTAAAATIGFHGRFEILSISATFLSPAVAALSPGISGQMSISLAGPQGQVMGGLVVGPLLAAETVVIVAAAFLNPTFHRLPAEDDASLSISVFGGDVGAAGEVEEQEQHLHHQNQQHQQQEHQQQRNHGSVAASSSEPCGVSISSRHLSSSVILAPISRPPRPSSPPPLPPYQYYS
nr:PREDICTED: AT-hook motif nuclear-localized protein 17-like [Musa acuminata subsp. malaccensis]